MNTRWIVSAFIVSVSAVTLAQQTPPIQPKTVDTPKLPPIVLAGPPKDGEHIANAPLTVAEAVQIALAHQPQLLIAKASVGSAHGQALQAKAGLNPTVGVTAGGTRSQVLTSGNGASGSTSSVFDGLTGQLSANQLIFDFNRTRDQIRQASALERSAGRTYDQTVQDVIFQTKQAYFSYLQAKQQVTVDLSNVKSRQAQVDLTQAQLNAGLGAPADLVNAKTLLSQSSLQLLQANQSALQASVTLATTLGIDPRTPIVLADSSEDKATLADSNALIDQALKNRPEILSAEESLKAAGFGVSVARKSTVPSLNIGAGVSTRGTDNMFNSQTGFVSLTFNWTLIDGGVGLGKVRSAEASKQSAEAQLRQISLSVISDVAKAYTSIQSVEQQVQTAQAEVGNAQEGVRLAEGRYKAGVTTFQEIITAQAALVTAQTDQVNAIANLAIARANLDHAIGKL